jgi:hypothetical protein
MSTNKFYSTSFALTKLKHAITTAKSGQKCLVIPIDDNYLELVTNENGTAVYMQTDVCVKPEKDTNDNWGFVKQKLPSKIYKEFGAEKSKTIDLPFLANLKVFGKVEEINVVNAEVINQDEVDDLPF